MVKYTISARKPNRFPCRGKEGILKNQDSHLLLKYENIQEGYRPRGTWERGGEERRIPARGQRVEAGRICMNRDDVGDVGGGGGGGERERK